MAAPRSELGSLRLFLTDAHPCSYLAGHTARNLVADPLAVCDTLYSALVLHGFRRSGEHVYRPHCQGCHACQSLRIPVQRFEPSRSQRRTAERNRDLQVALVEPVLREEHFRLFARYLALRHPDGGMDDATPESYLGFIRSNWSRTFLAEFREPAGRLLAVAVIDALGDGLSAVYTYYEPEADARALGTQAILWQIGEARRRALPHVYLGYWIAGCRKMNYKTRFRPCEVFVNGDWRAPPGTGTP